jgi:hypothetical protein
MTRLVFHLERNDLPSGPTHGEIPVWLYGGSPPAAHIGTVGAQAIEIAARFGVRPSSAAIDFLSIAMAVTAADTFVMRDDASDAWSRSFEIVLPLAEPARWEPLRSQLEAALRFLSNDEWFFKFVPGGARPPLPSEIRRKIDVFDLSKVDCVSLFSGGLDSGIGALDLIAAGCRPLLVSHAARGDARHQAAVESLLPRGCQRVCVNTYPTWSGADDDSMRTRSLQFLALGTLSAQAVAAFRGLQTVELFVSENGLIALNPPLTPRRIGSHSTRTAHPFFLESICNILSAAGLPVTIINPYKHRTKGEMASVHRITPNFETFVEQTVSCGKWKRENQQCGRCVPCLIRRASPHAAGILDRTNYQSPRLAQVLSDEGRRDDLIAVQSAILRYRGADVKPWVLQAGPLPADPAARQEYFDVVHRGMDELTAYLRSEGFSL